jgi:hypothetical protein
MTQATNENTQKRGNKNTPDDDDDDDDDDDGSNNDSNSSLTRMAMFETLEKDGNNSELCF